MMTGLRSNCSWRRIRQGVTFVPHEQAIISVLPENMTREMKLSWAVHGLI